MARPTITDVARLAHVSKTTVSYVISGTGYVSDERRARIEMAIAHLDYQPNAFAQRLSSRRVSAVGIISANPADPFVARVTSGVITEACARDVLVTMAAFDPSAPTGDPCRGMSRQASDALIYVVSNDVNRAMCEALLDNHRVVLAGEADVDLDTSAVLVDPRPAALELGLLVAQSGHDRVAIVAPPPRSTMRGRVAAISEGLAAAGFALNSISRVVAPVTVRGGRTAADQLFGRDSASTRPTAVFCVDDSVAVGVVHQCRQLGLLVPDDVSVVGFGDGIVATTMTPRLASVRLPAERVGREALAMVVGPAQGGSSTMRARRISATSLGGDSIARPR